MCVGDDGDEDLPVIASCVLPIHPATMQITACFFKVLACLIRPAAHTNLQGEVGLQALCDDAHPTWPQLVPVQVQLRQADVHLYTS